jgi:hypothetical protein
MERHHYDEFGNYVGKKVIPAKRKTVHQQVQEQADAQNSCFDRSGYEGLIVTWVVCDNISLRQATSSRFQRLVVYRDPFLEDVLPDSHSTLSSWIKSYYERAKAVVRAKLKQAVSRITISFDGWKSDSDMDLLGVVAHYVDHNYSHRTVLLALTSTRGSHSGDNMSERLLHVLREYKISNSLGYFIADNMSSNDRAIELLSDHLPIDSNKQRLRCAAHIINLVCKAILLGIDDDCIEDALAGNEDVLEDGNDQIDQSIQRFEGSLRDEKAALAAWRKKGPVGKLHNLVIHIKESSARRQYFESKQKEVDPELPVYRVVVNGGVRWNSTHDMIDRALQLKDALELYQSAYRYDRDHPTNLDELTPDDWLELRELRICLSR